MALLAAVEQSDAAVVEQLVPLVPNLDIRNRQGWTPLMMAAYANDLPIATILMDAGADVNAATKKGTTVLMYAKTVAARHNRLDLICLLLERGADAQAVDLTGQSVLDYARFEGNLVVVRFIEEWIVKKTT